MAVAGLYRRRRDLVRIAHRLQDRGYVVATEGNLSCRLGGDRFLVTPTGRAKGDLELADLLIVDGAGRVLSGQTGRPSSEWLLHAECYRQRPDIGAIVHAHPPHATAHAAAHRPLASEILTETAALLGTVPLAEPAAPGTPEVPASIRDLVLEHDAILLANHGVVTVGTDCEQACHLLEMVERLAQVTLLAELAGGARPLAPERLAVIRKKREAADEGDG